MEFLPEIVNEYIENKTTPESDLLARLNRETHAKVPDPQMLSGQLQGRFLAMISKMLRPRRILEIGTFTGYAALCLAEGLAPDGKLVTIEVDPGLEEMANGYFAEAGMEDRIDMRIGNALEIIPQLGDPIDLVFIDADKGSYVNYFKLVLPKLPSGGVILADNVLWSGQVTDETVNDKETEGLRNFAKFVAADPAVEQVIVPLRDGIMMIRKL